MAQKSSPRHFIDISDHDPKTLRRIIDAAHAMKKAGKKVPANLRPKGIEDANLVMIFEKPSTRTRVSFDIAMRQLGGYAFYIDKAQSGRVLDEPFEQTQLNQYLVDMLDDPQARATWSRNGLAFAETADLFSMPQYAADLILAEPNR